MKEGEMSREAVRDLVEDYWRSFISTAQTHPDISAENVEKFEKQIASLASMMRDEQAHLFLRAVDEEREKLFREYELNPAGLKVRLGLLDAAPKSETRIDPHDHAAIVEAVRRDYADLQVIARGEGTIQQRAARVDHELDLRMRAYVSGMNMKDSAEFCQVYNEEYNRMVRSRLSERKNQTGCAVIVAVGLGLPAAAGSIANLFL